MSGNYFGFSATNSHFSQPQQSSYAPHGASAHHVTVFNPSPTTAHTSYVVASTARPAAAAATAAAYETTAAAYTAQPASQYYSTTTTQRPETHQQPAPSSTFRAANAATAYTTYTDATPTYEKQTFYQQPQQSTQSTTYFSTGGGRAGKSNYATYYQGGSSQPKPKPASSYQTVASSFTTPQAAPKAAQPKPASVVNVSFTPQAHSTPSSFQSPASSFSSNKKFNSPNQSGQQQAQYSGAGYSYDAAVFSAASNYYQQQQRPRPGMGGRKVMNGPGQKGNRPQKPPPKPSQLHYCDICKISCAGPLTYKEHLEGQKHKKKETAQKDTTQVVAKSRQPSYRCELCDVTCTGMDAYNAHIRGSKHCKVLNLYVKMGKPIPSKEPIKISPPSSQTPEGKGDVKTGGSSLPKKPKKATPKITFVAGSKYNSSSAAAPTEGKPSEASKPAEDQELKTDSEELKDDEASNILPVGEDYVEEIKNDEGKVVTFNCKLCECRFNDPNAKEMHMKGRRHRLQYKKKVDPSLRVEVKATLRNRRQQEDKMRRQLVKEDIMRRRDEETRWRNVMRSYDEDMFWRQMEEERYWDNVRQHEDMYMDWHRRGGPQSGLPPPPPRGGAFMDIPPKKHETEIDRYVLAKHGTIYPKEEELQSVQNMVSIIERALKMVSDTLTEADKPITDTETEAVKEKEKEKEKVTVTVNAEEKKEGDETTVKTEEEKEIEKQEQPHRIMKGVMRVGVLAKGLLLTGDLNMELIVLCGEKPTRTLLERVYDCLPKQLAEITEDKYEMSLCVEEAAIILSAPGELKMTMKVSLTSPVMRDPPTDTDASRDPPDVLDKEKCLAALAALRHAKWFQARASVLPSCVIVIRVLRDLCDRISTWAPLKGWPMELIVERVISSSARSLSPGDALKRIFEAVAGGLLLPGGPGIFDPCEREDSDSLDEVNQQQKEEITASAQHALRLIVFRQVHKVLNMEPIFEQPRNPRRNANRKRRREEVEGAGDESVEGKKDKKEGEEETMEASAAGDNQETK